MKKIVEKNIFIFWIGDISKIKDVIDPLKKQGFKINLGPTDKENKYLSKNFKYYKDSLEQKKYSFCSDVWRAYVMSSNEGMYIDATVKIGDDFHKLYEEVSKYDVWLPRVNWNDIAWNVIYSSGKNSYFDKVLEEFKKYNSDIAYEFFIGPWIADYVSYKMGHFVKKRFETYTVDGVTYDSIHKITDYNTIYKIGSGSWYLKAQSTDWDPKSYWEEARNKWGHKKTNRLISRFEKMDELPGKDKYRIKEMRKLQRKSRRWRIV